MVRTPALLCSYVPDFCLVGIGRSSQVEMLMCRPPASCFSLRALTFVPKAGVHAQVSRS